jgi:hypothetical protein
MAIRLGLSCDRDNPELCPAPAILVVFREATCLWIAALPTGPAGFSATQAPRSRDWYSPMVHLPAALQW